MCVVCSEKKTLERAIAEKNKRRGGRNCQPLKQSSGVAVSSSSSILPPHARAPATTTTGPNSPTLGLAASLSDIAASSANILKAKRPREGSSHNIGRTSSAAGRSTALPLTNSRTGLSYTAGTDPRSSSHRKFGRQPAERPEKAVRLMPPVPHGAARPSTADTAAASKMPPIPKGTRIKAKQQPRRRQFF